MPTLEPNTPANVVLGRVTLSTPAVGLPDLLVVVYDVDPGTKPEEEIARLTAAATGPSTGVAPVAAPVSIGSVLNELGDRIGSVLTAVDGSFRLEYGDPEFRIRNDTEKRPDLLVLVLAPEAPNKPIRDLVLFSSSEVRQNAGRMESFFIQLTPEDLKRAGLPIPTGGEPGDPEGDEALTALRARLKAGKSFFHRKSEILKQEIETEHTDYAARRTQTFSANVQRQLSSVSNAENVRKVFVREGESVLDKVIGNATLQIQEAFGAPEPEKRSKSSGHIYLSEAQRAAYEQYRVGDELVLPAEIVKDEILPAMFKGTAGAGANDFLMDHPAVRTCLRVVRGDVKCDGHTHGEDGSPLPPVTPTPTGDEEGDAGTAEPDDVFAYVATQMQHVTSPEGLVNFGVVGKKRPVASEIAAHVNGIQLEKGPADSPAYFDFHSLQIAFQHVWKEATDQGILEQGEALYDLVVGTGQEPTSLDSVIAAVRSQARFLKMDPQQAQPVPPVEVIFEFPDAADVWTKMSSNEQSALIRTTHLMLGKYQKSTDGNNGVWFNYISGKLPGVPYVEHEHLITNGGLEVIAAFRQKGQKILDVVLERVERSAEVQSDLDRYRQAHALANEISQKLKERYSFTSFAASATERSINFGVLLTYRQKWDPVGYQAGELVRTMPLAPGEKRSYQKRTVVKHTRSRKEIEDNLRITKTDTSDTSRAESEIVQKALNKNTFSLNTTTTFEVPLSDKIKLGNTVVTNTNNEAQRESNQTKKDFRESVIKAAQEYKNERKLEISDELTEETENKESGEISNPNDEITVTYLFYELQRQFRVNERLHRMRPVVLVAMEMPAPHEIDDDWIVRHDWMLKRSLMDDSFLYAFDCILSVRGDRLMLSELERTVLEQRRIVRDLRQNVRFYTDETGRMSRLMQAAVNKEADVIEDRDFWDGIPLLGTRMDAAENAIKGVSNLLGMGKGDDPREAARVRREGVKDSFERADRERRELMGRLEHESGVLNELTRQVAGKQKEINEKELLIVRLECHLKDHILHYMQAIWSYEHPDQRFFRLYNVEVPQLEADADSYTVSVGATPTPSAPLDAVANLGLIGSARKQRHVIECRPVINVVKKTLAEIAELDNLLGFKGNYAIFPLRESNVLTNFMMMPYVDSEFGLLDPDAPGNWSLEDFQKLYCCLKEEMGPAFAELEPALQEFYKQLLMDPLRPGELITVPTGSLFIEALPGEHAVLEDFKALHRAVDVKRAQAEVRRLELENIRYAGRVMAKDFEDPEIERKIVVEGGNVLVNPDPS